MPVGHRRQRSAPTGQWACGAGNNCYAVYLISSVKNDKIVTFSSTAGALARYIMVFGRSSFFFFRVIFLVGARAWLFFVLVPLCVVCCVNCRVNH